MKMKLQLDELAVETFDTTPLERGKGTVLGHQQCTCVTVCTCPGCPTCEGTCPGEASCDDTCWNTCDDWTCAVTCGLSQCETRCPNQTCRCQGW